MIKKTSLRFRLMVANILVKQVVIFFAGVFLLSSFDQLSRQHIEKQLSALAIERTENRVGNDQTHYATVRESYITDIRTQFRNKLILALGGIAALLLTSAWIQMNLGLRPAEMLRKSIERVRMGLDKRIGAGFPEELEPLIAETNRLLEAQELAVQRARARAGDLAHGLKTPLTAMSVLNEQLRECGERDVADDIARQLDTMSRHVYRELTRTRIAASSGLSFSTNFAEVLENVRPTIERLPRADDLSWRVRVDPAAAVAIEEDDAIELLANLLDNARKWARSAIDLSVIRAGASVVVVVEDDGPGVPSQMREKILDRGTRLDESVSGSGLGLTIVKDIVDAYYGGLEFYDAEIGGLGVRLVLPAPGTCGVDLASIENLEGETHCSVAISENGPDQALQSRLATVA